MATTKEIAQGYAARLRGVKGTITKTAGVQRATFKAELVAIFKEVDSFQRPDAILEALDGETGFKPGTFHMLKKSSVEATLLFEQYIDDLWAKLDI